MRHSSPHYFHWEGDGMISTKMPQMCAWLTKMSESGLGSQP